MADAEREVTAIARIGGGDLHLTKIKVTGKGDRTKPVGATIDNSAFVRVRRDVTEDRWYYIFTCFPNHEWVTYPAKALNDLRGGFDVYIYCTQDGVPFWEDVVIAQYNGLFPHSLRRDLCAMSQILLSNVEHLHENTEGLPEYDDAGDNPHCEVPHCDYY